VYRVVDAQGTDLIDKYRGKPTGPTIPLPGALEDLFAAAGRVSIAIRSPFSRIDLYDTRGRIVFGEITPQPGLRGGSVLISASPSATRGSGPRSGCGGTSRTVCHPRRIGDRGQWGVRSRRAARACRCRASGFHSSVAISTEAEKRCTRKLPIGLGVIVAARTMGARCCRSGSCRRSVRR
jgi:TupA-like ATPgrasp